MILIKTEEEIQKMRESCAIAATILDRLCNYVEPGITTYDLDQLGREQLQSFEAKSACHNYCVHDKLFPGYTCISVNEELVHGIGSMKRVLKEGDIVTIDVSVIYNGYIGDNARTVMIEPVPQNVANLVEDTRISLDKALSKAIPGNRVGDISYAVQSYIEGKKLSIVREFVGHGVGKSMHEDPQIPNFGRPKTGPKLLAGMTLAIEPMVNMGRPEVEYASDGWTVLTRDRKPCAHFEHTVLIGPSSGPEILTLPKK